MTDIEYTFQQIHETADRLARLTAKPELGLSTFFMAVQAQIDRLKELQIVQKAPPPLTSGTDAEP